MRSSKYILRGLIRGAAAASAVCLMAAGAHAAFIIEVDTDGLDDGVLTYNPNFSFGGDTTTASQSAASTAPFMSGGDSIYGGDGSALPDTYVFSYDPSMEADNLAIPQYTALGDGNYASGIEGGAAGIYFVYATWPISSNVSGGDTRFTGATGGDGFVTDFDQNAGGVGTGHFWYKVGEITWAPGSDPITVTQEPTGGNTFVSMRSAGMLFEYEAIPEPSVLALLGLGALFVAVRRRQR